MAPLVETIIVSAVGAGIPMAVGGFVVLIRNAAKKGRLARIEGVVVMIAKELPVHSQALQASLEAQRDGKCNGNVSSALEALERMQKERDHFYQKQVIGADR